MSRDSLHGANVPDWVIAAAGPRHSGWIVKNAGKAPDVGLVWLWALDNSGLPASCRRALDVIANLTDGAWTVPFVADRIGVEESTLRKRIVPRLIALGWLQVERPPNGSRDGWRWTATVPVDNDPDGSRTPGIPPADPGHFARGARAKRPRYRGQNARQGRDKDAKDAKGRDPAPTPRFDTSPNGVTASTPKRPTRTTSINGDLFWPTVAAIEALEHDHRLPTLERSQRHDVARFLVAALDGDAERIDLMLAFLVDAATPADRLIDVAADDLGIHPAQARRLVHPRVRASARARS